MMTNTTDIADDGDMTDIADIADMNDIAVMTHILLT
jgi:hypothetical protein